jgi:GTP pyrophosphokinase
VEDASVPEWDIEYRRRLPEYERLAAEIEFALDATTRAAGIKTHSVASRVKSIESLELKAQQKEVSNPLSEIRDLVGVRVVVLFLSDLPRLDELIQASFDITSADDKIAGTDPASFGYMSVHYLASLGQGHQGPRYAGLEGINFEIQARTVVMDAWATVSHYLDYKGRSSVPEELRRDFFALSGLFYVADQHFEMLAERAGDSQAHALQEVQEQSSNEIPVNLDTVQAFLIERFPDREHAGRGRIAEFVEELVGADYKNLADLEEQLDRAEDNFLRYEQDGRTGKSADGYYYADLAVARLSVALADEAYATHKYGTDHRMSKYALWG